MSSGPSAPNAGPLGRRAALHDLAALKRANPLEWVARSYGLDLRRYGAGRLVAFCLFHDDRRTPNLVLDLRDPAHAAINQTAGSTKLGPRVPSASHCSASFST